MAIQKDQTFYRKVEDLLRYKKLSISIFVKQVLLEHARHCDRDGNGSAYNHEIAGQLGIHKKNISRYRKGFQKLKIMTVEKQYLRGSCGMKESKFQINLSAIIELSISEDGEIKIDNTHFNYNKNCSSKDNCSENDTGQSFAPHVTVTTPSRHSDVVKHINKKQIQNQKQIYNVHDQNLNNIEELCHDIHFEDFWACYPRKEKKSKARDIWVRERLDTIADEIIADVRDRQVRHDRWEDRSFIPMPTTYLNQEGWKDEIIERRKLERKPGGQSQPGNIRSYAEQLARVANKINNPHLRSLQSNLAREVDEEF